MGVRLLARARADVRKAAAWVGERDRVALRRWSARLDAKLRALGESPGSGAPQDHIAPGLRMVVLGDYVILYRREGDDAVVRRVLHGKRDWAALLRRR